MGITFLDQHDKQFVHTKLVYGKVIPVTPFFNLVHVWKKREDISYQDGVPYTHLYLASHNVDGGIRRHWGKPFSRSKWAPVVAEIVGNIPLMFF